jgi:hypothetical protein
VLTLDDILLIRRNVPTTFVLSYGYKAIFLGLDHIRSEGGLAPTGVADTWVPATTVGIVLLGAICVALNNYRNRSELFAIDESVAGTAFLFGAGIYCGTFLLGTNFVYRLMFLLLCVPQLQDWQINANKNRGAELGLFCLLFGVLWLNGNADGHSLFLLLPQLLDWLLFGYLVVVLMGNYLRTATSTPTPIAPVEPVTVALQTGN